MLKMRKAWGPDGLFAEHLKFGGQAVLIWLLKILNSIIELKAIPDIFKCGSITPVYKGSGKDPLDKSNYRGITVASVLAKVLEFLILETEHCTVRGWCSSCKSNSLSQTCWLH